MGIALTAFLVLCIIIFFILPWDNIPWDKAVTFLIAIYGAGLSSYLAFRDRAKAKITFAYSTPEDWELTFDIGTQSYISAITVANSGRRRLYIKRLMFLLPRGCKSKYIEYSPTRPTQELGEGKAITYRMNRRWFDRIVENNVTKERGVVFVEDATGKKYYSCDPISRLWRIRRLR